MNCALSRIFSSTLLLAELPGEHQKTIGEDKNYDTRDFVVSCRSIKITPYIEHDDKRKNGLSINAQSSPHEGYKISMKFRKRAEETFGWEKLLNESSRSKYEA